MGVAVHILLCQNAVKRAGRQWLIMSARMRVKILQAKSDVRYSVPVKIRTRSDAFLDLHNSGESLREDFSNMVPVTLAAFWASDAIRVIEPEAIHFR